jgi:hypothetical protein
MPYISEYNTFYIDISGNLSNAIIDIIQTDISRNLATNDLFNSYRYLTYEKIIENKSLYKHAYDIKFDCIKHFFLIEERNVLKEYLSHYSSSISDEVIIICLTEEFTERPKDTLHTKLTHPKMSEKKDIIITIKYNKIIKEYISIKSLIEINIDKKTAYLISTILKRLVDFIEPFSRIRFADSSSIDIASRAISIEDLAFPLQSKIAVRAEGNSPVVEPVLLSSSTDTAKHTEFLKGIPWRSSLIPTDDGSKFIPINNYNFIINNIDKTQNAVGINIFFVTVCDDINLTELLIKSANINNIVINTVIIKNWLGFECKIQGIIEFLKYIKNDNDIVCFIDAYDILFNDNVDNIINKFFEFSCNILFSSEIYCYPYSNIKKYEDDKDFNSNSSIFSYLNSGCFIGYKKYVIEMLLWKDNNEIKNICKDGGDQNYFTQYFLKFYKSQNIKLDFRQDIFQSMCGINYENIFFCKDGKIYNKQFSKIPSILHFNGFGDMPIKKVKNTYNNELVPALKTFLNLIEKSKFDTEKKIVKIPFIYPYEVLVG